MTRKRPTPIESGMGDLSQSRPGWEWYPKPEGPDWSCAPAIVGERKCRARVDWEPCRRPAVAVLFRGSRRLAYAYCEDHMYGRWIERGQVFAWAMRETRKAGADSGYDGKAAVESRATLQPSHRS